MTNWKDNYLDYRGFRKLAEGLATSLTICFPFYLWLAGWNHPLATAIYLITTGSIKFIAGLTGTAYSVANWLMILLPIMLGLLIFAVGPRAGLYYPAAINLGFLLVFYSSLSAPENFVQRIAEKIEQRRLDSIGIRYTVYVTRMWCVFFLLNGLIALSLAWQQMLDEWTLYNGGIAYLIMALLLLGERLMRSRIQQKMRRLSERYD